MYNTNGFADLSNIQTNKENVLSVKLVAIANLAHKICVLTIT